MSRRSLPGSRPCRCSIEARESVDNGHPRTLSVGLLLLVLLTLGSLGCGRKHLDTREFPVEGGNIRIERWDDPVDNLKSHRIFWLPQGATEVEVVHEIWGTLDSRLEPRVEQRGVLVLRLGERCFERQPPDYPLSEPGSPTLWRPCREPLPSP